MVCASTLVVACSATPNVTGPADAQPMDSAEDVAEGNDVLDASKGGDADASDGSTRAGYGQPCTVGNDTTCIDGLFCLQGPSGGTVGFCTKTCPSTSSGVCAGTPPGTAAYCVVTTVDPQGDKGCAFLCLMGSQAYACPGALQCQTTDDPAGSGDYLCLP